MIRRFTYIFLLILFGCSSEVEVVFDNLEADIGERTFVLDNVIACAANAPNDPDEIFIFLYPRDRATDIRLYETISPTVDKNDFSNYAQVDASLLDVFNGYLLKFVEVPTSEKWAIVSFEEDGLIHLSNPIRLKQKSTATIYSDQVTIDQSISLMPQFSWTSDNDAAIYFQVVSDFHEDLLSGTYTLETNFQYSNINNVVLDINTQTPPDLIANETYNITVMAVSEDNWVHQVIQKSFVAQ